MIDAEPDAARPEPNPYSTPQVSQSIERQCGTGSDRLAISVILLFLLPAFASIVLAWPCVDYSFTIDHPIRTYFFLLGGNALILFGLWCVLMLVSRWLPNGGVVAETRVTNIVAITYGVTAAACWFWVGLGIVGWT